MISPVFDHGSTVPRLVVSSRHVTQERLVQEELRWTSNHDSLTQLPNRAHFHECLEEAIRQAAGIKRRIGLLVLDVDNLKQVNDALGHDAGDQLCEFAQRRKAAARPHDVGGRLGGDEFGVLLPSVDSADEIASAAENILTKLRQPFG